MADAIQDKFKQKVETIHEQFEKEGAAFNQGDLGKQVEKLKELQSEVDREFV